VIHPKISAWLNRPVGRGAKTTLDYLVELVGVNYGSMVVTVVDKVTPNDSFWKRAGLTTEEGVDLIKLHAFLTGMLEIVEDGHSGREVSELIQSELARKERGGKVYEPSGSEVSSFGTNRFKGL